MYVKRSSSENYFFFYTNKPKKLFADSVGTMQNDKSQVLRGARRQRQIATHLQRRACAETSSAGPRGPWTQLGAGRSACWPATRAPETSRTFGKTTAKKTAKIQKRARKYEVSIKQQAEGEKTHCQRLSRF